MKNHISTGEGVGLAFGLLFVLLIIAIIVYYYVIDRDDNSQKFDGSLSSALGMKERTSILGDYPTVSRFLDIENLPESRTIPIRQTYSVHDSVPVNSQGSLVEVGYNMDYNSETGFSSLFGDIGRKPTSWK